MTDQFPPPPEYYRNRKRMVDAAREGDTPTRPIPQDPTPWRPAIHAMPPNAGAPVPPLGAAEATQRALDEYGFVEPASLRGAYPPGHAGPYSPGHGLPVAKRRRAGWQWAAVVGIVLTLMVGCAAFLGGGGGSSAVGGAATSDAKPTAKPTRAQEQALRAAQQYVDTMPFSRKGLIQQLTAKAGSGFDKADAVWAVNRVEVDWNKEAIEAAGSYLEFTPMSRSELMRQLTSSAGDRFTRDQARIAVTAVGL